VRYLIVAGSVSVLSWSFVGLGIWLGWHYMVATVFSQFAPIPIAFPLYRGLVFLGAPVMVEGVGLDPVTAQVVITAIIAVGSYLAHRFFTFRRNRGTS
jgi:putative flippase GtrA